MSLHSVIAAPPGQAEFLFGWGAFAQLLDDLQDIQQGSQDGLLTIFSRTARPFATPAIEQERARFIRACQALAGGNW